MGIKSKNKISTEFSMSSMTDIVFLLLIFFMLTSRIVTPLGLKVNLPSSKVASMQPETVNVSVNEDLEYAINGKIIPKEQLESEMNKALAGKTEEERLVVLNLDKTVPVEHFVKIGGIAASLDAKVTVATKSEE